MNWTLLLSLHVHAIGFGVVSLAFSGVWLAFLTGAPAALAASSSATSAALLVMAGVLGLLAGSRPSVANTALRWRWVSLTIGVAGVVLNLLLVVPYGIVVSIAIALSSLMAIVTFTSVVGAPQRPRDPSLVAFPPLD